MLLAVRSLVSREFSLQSKRDIAMPLYFDFEIDLNKNKRANFFVKQMWRQLGNR